MKTEHKHTADAAHPRLLRLLPHAELVLARRGCHMLLLLLLLLLCHVESAPVRYICYLFYVILRVVREHARGGEAGRQAEGRENGTKARPVMYSPSAWSVRSCAAPCAIEPDRASWPGPCLPTPRLVRPPVLLFRSQTTL